MVIRSAVLDDLTVIQSCAEAAYAPYVAAMGRKPAPMVADFAGQIARGQVWVAEDRGLLVGYVVCFAKENSFFLENVAVFPEHAGYGVGRRLIAFCEAQARAAGFTNVTLYTNEKMTANLTLYPKLGYLETDRRCEDGFDRVYFEKRL